MAVYVFLGGGIGAVLRYWMSVSLSSDTQIIPWQTFAANFVSCVLLGIFLALSRKYSTDNTPLYLFLMTGICGGFSTFSTFSMENLLLLQQGQWMAALAYTLLSVVVCVLGVWAGMMVMEF